MLFDLLVTLFFLVDLYLCIAIFLFGGIVRDADSLALMSCCEFRIRRAETKWSTAALVHFQTVNWWPLVVYCMPQKLVFF